MAPPTVGKQVFLRVATATTTVMRCMTSEDATEQKAADGRKKSPATPVKKQTLTVLTKGKKKIGNGLAMQPSRQDGATWGRRERTNTKATVFVPATAGLFLPPKADFLYFAAFQPADRQARMGVAANVRERALDDIADSHKRKGRSPEKPQIFLYLYHADYAYYNRRRHFFLAI